MKASTILFFLFFTPIFNLQNQYSWEQHKIDQLLPTTVRDKEEKYQELDALYSQHQELIDKYMKPELLQKFKKLGLFIEKEQEKLPEVEEDVTQEEATTQESLSGLQQVQGDLGEVEEGTYEVKSVSESLEGIMDDVGKDDFVLAMGEWIVSVSSTLVDLNTYAAVSIDPAKVQNIQMLFTSNLPIISEIQTVLGSNPKDVAEIIQAIKTVLEKYNTIEKREAHYKANRKAYRPLKNQPFEIKPTAETILNSIKAALDTKNENHPDKIAEEEARIAEEEADFKVFYKEFIELAEKESYNLDTISIHGNTDLDLRILDLDKLEATKSTVNANEVSESLRKLILIDFIGQLNAKKALVTSGDAKEILQKIFEKQTTLKNAKTVYQLYTEKEEGTKSMLNVFPTGFAAWVNEASVEVDANSFAKVTTDWQKEAVGAVDALRDDLGNTNLSFKVDPKRLAINLAFEFEGTLGKNATEPGADILKDMLGVIPSKKFLTLEELDDAWTKALEDYANKKSSAIIELYKDHILANIEKVSEGESVISSYNNLLPSKDSLKVAIRNSRYYSKPHPKPKTDIAITASYKLHKKGDTGHYFEVDLNIPLCFGVFEGNDKKPFYIATPDPTANVEVIPGGANSFQVSTNATTTILKPHPGSGSGQASIQTTCTVKLRVTDTSEQTVVEEGQVGEYDFLDVNSSAIQEKLEDLGVELPKIVGGKIQVVGDEYGNVDMLKGTITLMGLDFEIGVGKDGYVAKFKNSLEYQERKLQKTYGASTFDIYLSFDYSAHVEYAENPNNSITVSNLRLGDAVGGNLPEELSLESSEGCERYLRDVPKVED
jgi:hypothetical protein